MMEKLNNNIELVVYITGGASGLGESAARYLYSKGHKIAIADINEERMDILKKEFCG
jgi:NADP-dependent 3-hydroxy acid dehydrogenase YdfG